MATSLQLNGRQFTSIEETRKKISIDQSTISFFLKRIVKPKQRHLYVTFKCLLTSFMTPLTFTRSTATPLTFTHFSQFSLPSGTISQSLNIAFSNH